MHLPVRISRNILMVRQVQLVPDSLGGGQVIQRTHSAPECLCHHQVIPVDVQDLPSPLVDTIARQLLPTLRAGYPHLPHHQPKMRAGTGGSYHSCRSQCSLLDVKRDLEIHLWSWMGMFLAISAGNQKEAASQGVASITSPGSSC